MKFKKISTRMLAFILPVFILAMGLLTLISALKSRQIIRDETQLYMTAQLQSSKSEITDYLDSTSSAAFATARMFGNNYKTMQISDIENSLKEIANDHEWVFGCGVWFAPYVYQSDKKYMGPYAYKDSNQIVLTYDYSNETYDYINQPYYMMTKDAKTPSFTDPYYDETSGISMSTCAAPIYDANGTYLGCVTLDISLETIQQLITNVKIGTNGESMLVQKDGTYLAAGDATKVEQSKKITEESNKQLQAAGKTILKNENGMLSYNENGKAYYLYYTTFASNGWKLIAKIPEQDMNQPTQQLVWILVVICVVSVIISVIIVLYQVRFISKRIKRVEVFAGSLAEGDFAVDPLKIYAEDELGSMGKSLNIMFEKNRNILNELSNDAKTIYSSSENLSDSAKLLLEEFQNIEAYMSSVNEEMVVASQAINGVHASAQQVDGSAKILNEEAARGKSMVDEIKVRAKNVESISRDSYENAFELSETYEGNLQKSIENAKVVEEIEQLAEVISGIAEQINLLSLNASIEAARAGEQGKGFAVVAEEIGKLAMQTSETVNEIQDTISKVQIAFSDVTSDSKKIISFVSDVVTPDYKKFVEIGEQYGLDADAVDEMSRKISEKSNAIKDTISQVTKAIQEMNESAQRTAQNTAQSMKAVESLSEAVKIVSDMSSDEKEIANNLNDVASKFIIDRFDDKK